MGEATRDLLVVLGIFVALGVVWFVTGGPARSTNDKPFLASPLTNRITENPVPESGGVIAESAPADNQTTEPKANRSPWYRQVRLSLGSGSYQIQANDEYLVLSSNSSKPINITGWKIVGDKQQVVYQPAAVTIPSGVLIYDPRVPRRLAPIVLQPNDQAFIITGQMATAKSPYLIDASFKTNKCSGYIGTYPNYQFTPPLFSNCPAPTSVPGYDTINTDCTRYLESLASCHTPDFRYVADYTGTYQPGYVDYTANLDSQCKAFIQSHYNYNSCLDDHLADQDFLGQTWYVYLNLIHQQWDSRHEVIKLFDQNNLLVDELTY